MTKSCLNIIWVVINLWPNSVCGGRRRVITFTLPVAVRTICHFDDFEKLTILLQFSRNILEGWARVVAYTYF